HQDHPGPPADADRTRGGTAPLRTSRTRRGRYRRRTAGLPGLDRRRDPPGSRRLNRLTALLVRVAALALLALALPVSAAVDEGQLLPVDQAFALQARAGERGRIEIDWTIAERSEERRVGKETRHGRLERDSQNLFVNLHNR